MRYGRGASRCLCLQKRLPPCPDAIPLPLSQALRSMVTENGNKVLKNMLNETFYKKEMIKCDQNCDRQGVKLTKYEYIE